MARKYFGTDGVRGEVGVAPITPDFVMRLGYAAGKVLAKDYAAGTRPTVLIGKDTRISGYMLEAALEAGFSAAGVDVMLAASQKGLMTPPGLGFVYVGPRAAEARARADAVTPYWDWAPRIRPEMFYQLFGGTAPTQVARQLGVVRDATDALRIRLRR